MEKVTDLEKDIQSIKKYINRFSKYYVLFIQRTQCPNKKMKARKSFIISQFAFLFEIYPRF